MEISLGSVVVETGSRRGIDVKARAGLRSEAPRSYNLSNGKYLIHYSSSTYNIASVKKQLVFWYVFLVIKPAVARRTYSITGRAPYLGPRHRGLTNYREHSWKSSLCVPGYSPAVKLQCNLVNLVSKTSICHQGPRLPVSWHCQGFLGDFHGIQVSNGPLSSMLTAASHSYLLHSRLRAYLAQSMSRGNARGGAVSILVV